MSVAVTRSTTEAERARLARLSVSCIAVIVGRRIGTDPAMLRPEDFGESRWSRSRRARQSAQLRELVAYLANTRFGVRIIDIAAGLSVSEEAVRKALARVEDRRDREEFDTLVAELESELAL